MTPYALLTAREYALARRADHGSLWRFLAGCRCIECDRPAHHRFRAAMRPHRQVVDSPPMQAATVGEDAQATKGKGSR